MSQERRMQWAHRLQRLQVLRERFAQHGRYDRAQIAHQAVQHVYDRWAHEVFATRR